MQEHHVAFVFAKLLELRLGHGFLRIHLQLGQQRVELSTDDLSLFMIRTMKAQRKPAARSALLESVGDARANKRYCRGG
jgi:hypothetical protein